MSTEQFNIIDKLSASSKQQMVHFLKGLLKQEPKESAVTIVETNTKDARLQQYFNKITAGLSLPKARDISKAERATRLMNRNEYNYGEIDFPTFQRMIKMTQPYIKHEQPIFYDLGSGTGKQLVAASLTYPFSKCIGIEILTSLYEESVRLSKKIELFREQVEDLMLETFGKMTQLPTIQVRNSDFRTEDWSDGSVIFASSTCYTPILMKQLYKYSLKLKKDTVFITLSRKLNEYEFDFSWKVVATFQGKTSWGNCTIYIQVKQE